MSHTAKLRGEIIDGIDVLSDPNARSQGWLVAFTSRRGGVSAAPYDSLNLAARVGDKPDPVASNRKRAASAVGFDVEQLALARQVHEADLIEVHPGATGVLGQADGLTIDQPGPVAAILTADCAPVVIATDDSIAVLHAGWRGLVAGVVETGIEKLGDVRTAWVGPCIHSCCYEVGPEVTEAFSNKGLPVAAERRVDPAQAAAAALRNAGVDNVAVAEECTHCSNKYFSYRRDGVTGRQGAFAGLLE
jgi:polyphenol oxidase